MSLYGSKMMPNNSSSSSTFPDSKSVFLLIFFQHFASGTFSGREEIQIAFIVSLVCKKITHFFIPADLCNRFPPTYFFRFLSTLSVFWQVFVSRKRPAKDWLHFTFASKNFSTFVLCVVSLLSGYDDFIELKKKWTFFSTLPPQSSSFSSPRRWNLSDGWRSSHPRPKAPRTRVAFMKDDKLIKKTYYTERYTHL